MINRPRLFVGSSVEGLPVAYALNECLEYDAEVTVWQSGVFRPSRNILADLIQACGQYNFAAFVFTPDDIVEMRGDRVQSPRDNVIFELGLFMGSLGVENCFYILPRDEGDIRLPSDLLGLNPLSYNAKRSDRNLVAALGHAANQIRHAFRKGQSRQVLQIAGSRTIKPLYSSLTLADYIHLWESTDFKEARQRVREFPSDPTDPENALASKYLEKLFIFFEGLSDSVLCGQVSELEARKSFGEAVLSIWPVIASNGVPPSVDQDDYWRELPQLAILYRRWSAD